MFQKFSSDNLTTRFIKNLVSTIYIPTASIWKPGKPLIKDFVYITRDHVVRALIDYDPDTDNFPVDIHNTQQFEIVGTYIEGMFYPGMTTKYNSGTSIYDAKTHQYLGQYLRQVRDLHNIDLMPFYNCWDGTVTSKVRLAQDIDANNKITYKFKEHDTDINDGFTVLTIPVKFYEKYTVYINSSTPIRYTFAYSDGINITKIDRPYDIPVKTIDYVSYNNPVLIESLKPKGANIAHPDNANTIYKEDYLTLLIQIPSELNSPIFVTEGDTRENKLIVNNYPSIINAEIDNKPVKIADISNPDKSAYFVGLRDVFHSKQFHDEQHIFRSYSPSSMMRTVGSNSYAFNSRLIEYLLWNVISQEDLIAQDIVRVQEYINTNKCEQINGFKYDKNVYGNLVKGVYTDNLQEFIYKLCSKTKKNPIFIDINGYVDKDVEQILLRGKQ